jgi:DNA modification methylase
VKGSAVVIRGDARNLPLPDASVDLICCSPPYFGLRSYTDGGVHFESQIGSEASPREWLAALVACTREWVRVLKPSGSIFVNLGDKYSGNETGGALTPPGPGLANPMGMQQQAKRRAPYRSGLPPKSLLGLPWRYALACTDDLGLILRRDIIWSKPNGLPESVTDRCRSSHEYVFHLVRQPRYYAAVDEIREPHDPDSWRPSKVGRTAAGVYHAAAMDRSGSTYAGPNPSGKLPGSVWSIPSQPLTVPAHLGVDHFASFPMELPRRCVLGWSPPGVCTGCGEGRRPVTDKDRDHTWGALACRGGAQQLREGAAVTGMTTDGRWLNRITITGYACACTPYTDHPGTGGLRPAEQARSAALGNGVRDNPGGGYGNAERTGPWREYHLGDWTPPPARPALVLDPFGGTGTTALVAAAYGRTGVSVDLSGDYCRLARWRTQDPGERARALLVPKPPPVPEGQGSLFDDMEAS